MKIPDRWLDYENSGRIEGTRFVAFKVPLRKGFNRNIPEEKSFTSEDLLRRYPEIKLVIDLTFTNKYYNAVEEFENKGVHHIKLKCQGHCIPKDSAFNRFVEIVEDFISKAPPDYLIGVHCTHGVNRTGYVIVRYMIERLGYLGEFALKKFQIYRSHGIERYNYVDDLLLRGNRASPSGRNNIPSFTSLNCRKQ